jgi:hypothetical protein
MSEIPVFVSSLCENTDVEKNKADKNAVAKMRYWLFKMTRP